MPENTRMKLKAYPAYLGVSCDHPGCVKSFAGDYVVGPYDSRSTRLGYVLKDAVSRGWTAIGEDPAAALTLCPEHSTAGPTQP